MREKISKWICQVVAPRVLNRHVLAGCDAEFQLSGHCKYTSKKKKDLPELNFKSCKCEDRGSLSTSGDFHV